MWVKGTHWRNYILDERVTGKVTLKKSIDATATYRPVDIAPTYEPVNATPNYTALGVE